MWFSWTATASDTFEVNTFGSNFDTYLIVYSDGPAPGIGVSDLVRVAEDDNAPGSLQSQLTFAATSATTTSSVVAVTKVIVRGAPARVPRRQQRRVRAER